MPKSMHRENAPARPRHPRPKAIQPQARTMTHLPVTTTPK